MPTPSTGTGRGFWAHLDHVPEDFTGRKFGRLTVQERFTATTQKGTFWRCLCDCGATHVARADRLKQGRTKACHRWCGLTYGNSPEELLARCEREGDCLIWIGAVSRTAPVLKRSQRQMSVRRVLYEAKFGPLPRGNFVHNNDLCRNSLCCNVDHLTTRRRVGVPAHRALATCFRSDEVALMNQLINALLLGRDVRQLVKQRALSSLFNKFKKLHAKAESSQPKESVA